MHEGPHDDHVGTRQGGMIAQCLGHVAVQGRQIQDVRVYAMACEMRSNVGTWNGVLQILLAGDANQLDLLGGPQEGQGVIERPCCLGAAIPRHEDPSSCKAVPAFRHHDERAAAVGKHRLDQPSVNGQGNRFGVQNRPLVGPCQGGEALDQVRIGKLRCLGGAGEA
jgi:hypothetical protein